MATAPNGQPATTASDLLSETAVEAARVDILKRELAVSRGLMVRARNGLEASRQATAAVRADLTAAAEAAHRERQQLQEPARRKVEHGRKSHGLNLNF